MLHEWEKTKIVKDAEVTASDIDRNIFSKIIVLPETCEFDSQRTSHMNSPLFHLHYSIGTGIHQTIDRFDRRLVQMVQ